MGRNALYLVWFVERVDTARAGEMGSSFFTLLFHYLYPDQLYVFLLLCYDNESRRLITRGALGLGPGYQKLPGDKL